MKNPKWTTLRVGFWDDPFTTEVVAARHEHGVADVFVRMMETDLDAARRGGFGLDGLGWPVALDDELRAALTAAPLARLVALVEVRVVDPAGLSETAAVLEALDRTRALSVTPVGLMCPSELLAEGTAVELGLQPRLAVWFRRIDP